MTEEATDSSALNEDASGWSDGDQFTEQELSRCSQLQPAVRNHN